MAENVVDSGQSNGTPASPNAGGSVGNGDSNGSNDASKLQSTIEALTKKLDEVDARSKALQSDKDRGVNKTKEEVTELKRKIAEIEKLKKAGLDEDGAIEELSFRDEIRAVRQQLSQLNPTPTQPAGNGNGQAVDKAKTLQEYGLSENDPDVATELSGKVFNTALELENAALKIAYKRANKPQPDNSAAPAYQSGTPNTPPNEDKIYSELAELSKNYTANKSKIEALQARLK